MCNPISGITKSDGTIYMPDPNAWNHSHTEIAKLHGLPDGEWGDRFARWELTPKDGASFRTNPGTWNFRLDEKRTPDWWTDDAPALEHAAREAVKRWLVAADRMVPGFAATGGYGSTLTGGNYSTLTGGDRSTLTGGYRSTLTGWDGSTLTGGNYSTLTGGDRSTLTGGNHSTLTGGYGSTLTGGDGSTLTGGDGSTLTGGDHSTLEWLTWNGTRRRRTVRYTGEDGIEVGVAYTLRDGAVVKSGGVA